MIVVGNLPHSMIGLNLAVKNNLLVLDGDEVSVTLCMLPAAKKILILPIKDTMEGLPWMSLTHLYLQPYFRETIRAIHLNDVFSVKVGNRSVEFKGIVSFAF